MGRAAKRNPKALQFKAKQKAGPTPEEREAHAQRQLRLQAHFHLEATPPYEPLHPVTITYGPDTTRAFRGLTKRDHATLEILKTLVAKEHAPIHSMLPIDMEKMVKTAMSLGEIMFRTLSDQRQMDMNDMLDHMRAVVAAEDEPKATISYPDDPDEHKDENPTPTV